MEIIVVFIVLGLIGISGWAYSIYINTSWFKDLSEASDKWYEICIKLNNDWANRCIELAKKVDELTAEKNKEEKMSCLCDIDLVDEEGEQCPMKL